MASIIPYEIPGWEKLFWFLKFLIPKLVVKTKEDELIDELLESVDLSTYGLEEKKDPLDEIIQTFNERWFQGWDSIPNDQKIMAETLSQKGQMDIVQFTKKLNEQFKEDCAFSNSDQPWFGHFSLETDERVNL